MYNNNMKDAQEPNSDLLVLCMDLEKVLFVLTLTHSQMYYRRQLSVYNLCLHVGDTRKSYVFSMKVSLVVGPMKFVRVF